MTEMPSVKWGTSSQFGDQSGTDKGYKCDHEMAT